MLLRLLLFLFLLSVPAGAAALFVPPDPTETLFQRDRLPIDPDRMRTLSEQLTVLASRPPKTDPAQFRATAQLLAIAGRLNPANTRVRALTQTYSRHESPVPPDQRQWQQAVSESWQMIDWLRSKEAGTDGQRLGEQLLDTLRIIDPSHPKASQHDPDGEAERWLGVVAPLDKFTPPAPDSPPSPETKAETIPQPMPIPEPEPEPGPLAPPIQLRSGSVRSPLFVYDQSYQQSLKIVPITLNINKMEDLETLRFGLDPKFDSVALATSQEHVRSALLTLWPALPAKEFAVLTTDNKRYASRNGTAVSGAAGLLLHAALAGKLLRDDLTIIGDLQADGSLKRPKYAWDYLATLRGGPGGRLLVPPDLKDELQALIVLEDPEFFIKYEVLVVSTLDTALRLGTPGGDPPDLVAASTIFSEIQSAAKGRDIAPLTALESVRSRLITVRQAAPYHLSAAALLLQGSGKDRPTRLQSSILARELARALDPMSWMLRAEIRSIEASKIHDSWELIRLRLDTVEKFTDIKDRPLHQQAREISDDLRTLSREIKRIGGRGEGLPSKVFKELNDIRRKHGAFLNEVAKKTGEPVDQPKKPMPPQGP